MTSRPLTVEQLAEGIRQLDRANQHVFALDPGLDRDETFDTVALLSQVADLARTEQDLAYRLATLPRGVGSWDGVR